MKGVIKSVICTFVVCAIIGFGLWVYLGGYHLLKNHYVSVTCPMTSISDTAIENIKNFEKPGRIEFNNCEYTFASQYYVKIVDNAEDAEQILEQDLVLPEACKNNELLMQMDTDCSYIEIEPRLAKINDTWCEIKVYYKLAYSGLHELTCQECNSSNEYASYTKEKYTVDGQDISLYYFENTSYAIYYNNDVTYVCKIHSGSPDDVKSIVDTI